MRRKNSKRGLVIGYIVLAISGIFTVIGAVADLFDFVQRVSENKETILGIIGPVVSFLVRWWKCALIFVVVVAVIIILYRRAQKKEIEERQTRNLSWFDARRRNTEYSGGVDYLFALKQFFLTNDSTLSWWAVTGVTGIGKTRLTIEALRDKKFAKANVQWIRSFDDYREDALRARVDKILEQPNLWSIIIAEDAQIYMDNIGMLIGYITEKPAAELGKHIIRVLLIIRTGEDEDLRDRYKQLASKTRQSILQKNRFNAFDKELKIERYMEEDIAQIVKTYVVNTKKKQKKDKILIDDKVAEIQTKTIQVLKSEKMDPGHLRPLFAMFIADALLEGKDPMEWDLRTVLEYAIVEREEELLQLEVRDIQRNVNFRVFDKIRGIICLSFIRDGIALSELDDIKEELEEELRNTGINVKDFFRELQLLGDDSVIRLSMPDILSEYYVLRSLVIKPDAEIVNWIIGQLCSSLQGAEVFRQKIRQDFRYLYDEIKDELDDFYNTFFESCSSDLAYAIILNLVLNRDLSDSNSILFQKAIENQIRNDVNQESLSNLFVGMIIDAQKIEERREYLSELKQLSEKNEGNDGIVLGYCKGLVAISYFASEIEEKWEYRNELKRLSRENGGNVDIILEYCKVLLNLIYSTADLEKKRECLRELTRLSRDKRESIDIVLEYCKGLYIMRQYDEEQYNYCIGELYRLLLDKKVAQYIAAKEPNIIIYTRKELLDYESKSGNDGLDNILRGLI